MPVANIVALTVYVLLSRANHDQNTEPLGELFHPSVIAADLLADVVFAVLFLHALASLLDNVPPMTVGEEGPQGGDRTGAANPNPIDASSSRRLIGSWAESAASANEPAITDDQSGGALDVVEEGSRGNDAGRVGGMGDHVELPAAAPHPNDQAYAVVLEASDCGWLDSSDNELEVLSLSDLGESDFFDVENLEVRHVTLYTKGEAVEIVGSGRDRLKRRS